MFLMATLTTGGQVVSEFTELKKVQKYAQDIFAGRASFNAWKVVSNVHPASGEKVLIRERLLISGEHIVSIQQVQPTTTEHEYMPNYFVPVQVMKEGDRGLWQVPEGTTVEVDGVIATPGLDYPHHREARSLREYVILRAANDAEGVPEVRYYTDGQPAPDEMQPANWAGGDDDDADDDDTLWNGHDDDDEPDGGW